MACKVPTLHSSMGHHLRLKNSSGGGLENANTVTLSSYSDSYSLSLPTLLLFPLPFFYTVIIIILFMVAFLCESLKVLNRLHSGGRICPFTFPSFKHQYFICIEIFFLERGNLPLSTEKVKSSQPRIVSKETCHQACHVSVIM